MARAPRPQPSAPLPRHLVRAPARRSCRTRRTTATSKRSNPRPCPRGAPRRPSPARVTRPPSRQPTARAGRATSAARSSGTGRSRPARPSSSDSRRSSSSSRAKSTSRPTSSSFTSRTWAPCTARRSSTRAQRPNDSHSCVPPRFPTVPFLLPHHRLDWAVPYHPHPARSAQADEVEPGQAPQRGDCHQGQLGRAHRRAPREAQDAPRAAPDLGRRGRETARQGRRAQDARRQAGEGARGGGRRVIALPTFLMDRFGADKSGQAVRPPKPVYGRLGQVGQDRRVRDRKSVV